MRVSLSYWRGKVEVVVQSMLLSMYVITECTAGRMLVDCLLGVSTSLRDGEESP